MQTSYKERILQEIEKIPNDKKGVLDLLRRAAEKDVKQRSNWV